MSSKISALAAAATLDGTEIMPGVQAAGNVGITPNQIATLFGTWTSYVPVWTGFSVGPTVGYARSIKIGKTCIVQVWTTANGTSDATTTTVTLPFAAAADNVQIGLITSLANNGSLLTSPGVIATRVNSNIADLFINMAAGAWTASNGKRASFTLIYQTT